MTRSKSQIKKSSNFVTNLHQEMSHYDGSRSMTAGLCSCFAFVFALAAVLSPYVVWSNYYYSAITVSSGPFVLSRFYFGVNGGSMTYGDLNDSACSDANITVSFFNTNQTVQVNNFEDWSQKYGFCSTANGSVSVPTPAKVIQAFTIIATVAAFLAMLLSCGVVRMKDGLTRKLGFISAFIGLISAIVAYAQIASWNYFTDLRNGNGFIITMLNNGDVAGLPTSAQLSLGPSFFGLVFVSILFVGVMYILRKPSFRQPEFDEDDLVAAHRSGNKPVQEVVLV